MFDKAFGNTEHFSKKRQHSLYKQSGEELESKFLEPSTAEVIGAHVSNVFKGPGSAQHMVKGATSYVSEEKDDNAKLTKEEYINSDSYRKEIPYDPSMTQLSARIKSDNFDRKARNDLIISNATTGQNITGMGSALASGFVEPANIIATIIAAPLALVSRFSRYKKLYDKSRTTARLTKGAVEGAVGQAILEPFARASAKELEEDYTMANSLANVGASAFFGGVLNAGIGKLVDWRRGKKGLTQKTHNENLDTAVTDLVEGRDVEVTNMTGEGITSKYNPETNGEIGDFDAANRVEDTTFKTEDEHLALEAEQQANQEIELLRNENPDLLEDVDIKASQKEIEGLELHSKTQDGIIGCITGS